MPSWPSHVEGADYEVAEVLVASAARTTSGDSGGSTGYAPWSQMRVFLIATAAAGVSPTLDAVIEDSPNGTDWFVIGTFAQLTAAGRQALSITTPFADRIRVRWTITGTAPSFTFSVEAVVGG